VFSRACMRWQSCFDVVVLDLKWTWMHQVPPKLSDGNLVNGKVEPDHVFCFWSKLMERRLTPKSNWIRSTLIAPFASGFRRWKFRCVDWFWLTLGALSLRQSGHGRVFLVWNWNWLHLLLQKLNGGNVGLDWSCGLNIRNCTGQQIWIRRRSTLMAPLVSRFKRRKLRRCGRRKLTLIEVLASKVESRKEWIGLKLNPIAPFASGAKRRKCQSWLGVNLMAPFASELKLRECA